MPPRTILRSPLLQLALDNPQLSSIQNILAVVPRSDMILVEAGTPLIKKWGLGIIRMIRRQVRDMFVVADLKTLDAGRVEARLAYEESADGAVVSGLAPRETVKQFLKQSRNLGIYSIVDMLGVGDPISALESMRILPNIVLLHRAIDEESQRNLSFSLIRETKRWVSRKPILVGIAGGLGPLNARRALEAGADIVVVGRYVTSSNSPKKALRRLLSVLQSEARNQHHGKRATHR